MSNTTPTLPKGLPNEVKERIEKYFKVQERFGHNMPNSYTKDEAMKLFNRLKETDNKSAAKKQEKEELNTLLKENNITTAKLIEIVKAHLKEQKQDQLKAQFEELKAKAAMYGIELK